MKKQITIVLFWFFIGLTAPLLALAESALNESLIYHVYFGKAEDVKRLLYKGANANARDEHQWSALSIATDRSDGQAFPIAKLLVEAGANVNVMIDGQYPIITAIHNNNAELVKLLILHGANIDVSDDKGRTVERLAREAKDSRIADFISKIKIEEQQLLAYLRSRTHLRQIVERFAFNHCAYQYWGFYFKSGQDKNADRIKIEGRLRKYAREMKDSSTRAATFFPQIYSGLFQDVQSETRRLVYDQLNNMISNRNRRAQGVGTEKDFHKRCDAIRDAALKKI